MATDLAQREVAHIEAPAIRRGISDAHRVRPLIASERWAATDPFLRMMEDWFPGGVFDRHPHRGIETVTYVIEGRIEHYDNHGNTGSLGPGDVQWLTAGRGLIHNEQPAAGQHVHLLQLWVNLPGAAKLVAARHQDLRAEAMPLRREPGAEIRVFSGSSGAVRSQTLNHAPVTMVEITLAPGAQVSQDLPAGYNSFVVVLKGGGAIGASATAVTSGQLVWLTPCEAASAVGLTAGDQGLRALLLGGLPLREPVAAGGPFVMNTQQELHDAFAQLRSRGERFGL